MQTSSVNGLHGIAQYRCQTLQLCNAVRSNKSDISYLKTSRAFEHSHPLKSSPRRLSQSVSYSVAIQAHEQLLTSGVSADVQSHNICGKCKAILGLASYMRSMQPAGKKLMTTLLQLLGRTPTPWAESAGTSYKGVAGRCTTCIVSGDRQGDGQGPSACGIINIPQYSIQRYTRSMQKQQTSSLCTVEALQNALKEQNSLLPWRKAVE